MSAGPDRLAEAVALLSPDTKLRSDRLRERYLRRNARLLRRKLAVEQKRKQVLLDPIARALAKAHARSEAPQ